jgi:hypothetical protein
VTTTAATSNVAPYSWAAILVLLSIFEVQPAAADEIVAMAAAKSLYDMRGREIASTQMREHNSDRLAETRVMSSTEPPPGYSEAEIDTWLADRRLVAAVYAYAHDQLTLGQVMAIARPSAQEPLIPKWFNASMDELAYARMIHEIAKRTLAGRIAVTEDIFRDYPNVQGQFGAKTPGSLSPDLFSTIENMPPEMNPYLARREHFEEEDLRELIKDPRILACIHAFCQNLVTLGEARRRMFGNVRYPPRKLSSSALTDLAFEVCYRIKDGRITVPGSLQVDHPEAYVPQIIK